MDGPERDEFAASLGIQVARRGPGHTVARLTTDGRHANPHGTVHGAVFYAVAGAAIAAAANDEENSGIISSVLVEYLQPAAVGDELCTEVQRSISTDREDIFTGTVRRGEGRRPTGLGARPRDAEVPSGLTGVGRPEANPAEPAGSHRHHCIGCPMLRFRLMAESVGIMSLGRHRRVGSHSGPMSAARERQGRDPRLRGSPSHSTWPAPTRSSPGPAGPPPRSAGPAGTASRSYRRGGGLVPAESGLELGTAPLPGPSERIDTLVLAGGSGVTGGPRPMPSSSAGSRRPRPAAAGSRTVCSGTFIRRGRRHPAGPAGRHPLGPGGRAGRLLPRRERSTPSRIYLRDGPGSGRSAGVQAGIDLRSRWSRTTSGSTSPRRWPAGW